VQPGEDHCGAVPAGGRGPARTTAFASSALARPAFGPAGGSVGNASTLGSGRDYSERCAPHRPESTCGLGAVRRGWRLSCAANLGRRSRRSRPRAVAAGSVAEGTSCLQVRCRPCSSVALMERSLRQPLPRSGRVLIAQRPGFSPSPARMNSASSTASLRQLCVFHDQPHWVRLAGKRDRPQSRAPDR
jgi:hypothetical protein